MNWRTKHAEVYVPDGTEQGAALARTTRLCVAAHQDDIELMAYHGIAACFGSEEEWFCGTVVSDGAGSPRSGIYGKVTDEDMKRVRIREQKKAAMVGEYGAQIFLGYTSAQIKDPGETGTTEDILTVLKATRPAIVYTHNPADKHDTHVGVMLRTLEAIRRLPADERPQKVYGCEVWRSLDWMPDGEKILLDVSGHENIANALVSVFDSQICGGKRYDLAAQGRRLANATYAESHGVDQASAVSVAMDLTPLIGEDAPDLAAFVCETIDRFRSDVASRLSRLGRKGR